MKFRPCIDLHDGAVKQIVGGTLTDGGTNTVVNFTSERNPGWYAARYREDNLDGGHIIRLGPGNDTAAEEALAGWPGGLQIGGGINAQNAEKWLAKGAEKVIVTSYVFKDGQVFEGRLKELHKAVGSERLVLDLSCRKREGRYWIVTDRWQNFTSVAIEPEQLDYFSAFCSEFLIHAVDVEGQSAGIEKNLVRLLGEWAGRPMTYAGGIHNWEDIEMIRTLGGGQLDFTVGSALDLFGGSGLKYTELVSAFKKTNPDMVTITLLEPQIPQNTGNIGRLCAATDTPLEIVGAIGFKLSDRYLKRAGLDYWQYVNWNYFEDLHAYMAALDPSKIHLFSARSSVCYTEKRFQPGDYLIFGSETRGINQQFLNRYPERCCTVPMSNPGVRSLNLSSTVAVGLYEALRQNRCS